MYRMKKELTILAVLALIAGAAGAQEPISVTVADMLDIVTSEPVAGASILTRALNWVTVSAHTTGLDADAAYTIWWVIFNRPQHCVDGCGMDDFANASVRASVLWATGFVTAEDGTANVGTTLPRGQAPGQVLFGPGLLYPSSAEIHIVVRSHGLAFPGEVDQQISNFMGFCNPACVDRQASIHLPAQ